MPNGEKYEKTILIISTLFIAMATLSCIGCTTENIKDGDHLTLIDSHGKNHDVPVLKNINKDKSWKTKDAEVAMSKIPHLKRMECYSCHSVWAPQCYGCHLKEDFSGKTTGGVKTQVDWLTSTWNHDAFGRTQRTETPGKIEET
ncbi:MAG TPA: hypothetical protein VI387_11130, partial [Candidatus Brocadiales bacterium]|nr:hypothetical protein [Candidatus Brocadiales bacterium]